MRQFLKFWLLGGILWYAGAFFGFCLPVIVYSTIRILTKEWDSEWDNPLVVLFGTVVYIFALAVGQGILRFWYLGVVNGFWIYWVMFFERASYNVYKFLIISIIILEIIYLFYVPISIYGRSAQLYERFFGFVLPAVLGTLVTWWGMRALPIERR